MDIREFGENVPKKEVHMPKARPPYPPEFKAVRQSGYFRSSTERSIPQIELGRSISPTRDPAAQLTGSGSARQRDRGGKKRRALSTDGREGGLRRLCAMRTVSSKKEHEVLRKSLTAFFVREDRT